MSRTTLTFTGIVFALLAVSASAQDFQLQSAETIDQGNFKIGVYPVEMFGKHEDVDNFGVATRIGYGITSRFDIEARLNFFEHLKMYGGDAELWLVKGGPIDVSASAGFHVADFDSGINSKAFDVAALASGKIAPKLDLYVGVNASFESLDNVDNSGFQRVYLTPGLEYTLHRNVDLVAEFGLGLNGDSPNYVGARVAFYIR